MHPDRQKLVNAYLAAERALIQAGPNTPQSLHDAYWAAQRAVVDYDKSRVGKPKVSA